MMTEKALSPTLLQAVILLHPLGVDWVDRLLSFIQETFTSVDTGQVC